ncbi:hypothetical protein ABPG75_000202 [Micractinium tetrahymenae]
MRVVRSAADILSQGGPAEADHATALQAHYNSATFLLIVAEKTTRRGRTQQAQAAGVLLSALPCMAGALQRLAACSSLAAPNNAHASGILQAWALLATLLANAALDTVHGPAAAAGPAAAVRSGPSDQEWCSAAVRALQAFPALAAAATNVQQQLGGNGAQAASGLALGLLQLAAMIPMGSDWAERPSPSAGPELAAAGEPPMAAGAEQRVCPAMPLQEAACRLARWAAASPQALHSLLPPSEALPALLGLLSASFQVVASTAGPHCRAPAHAWSRPMAAAAAAHWQALQALLPGPVPDLPAEQCFHVASDLIHMPAAVPLAIAHSPVLFTLLEPLLRRVAEDSTIDPTTSGIALLALLFKAPRLAAHLLASGTLQALLEGSREAASGNAGYERAWQHLQSQACDGLRSLQAGAAEACSVPVCEDSSASISSGGSGLTREQVQAACQQLGEALESVRDAQGPAVHQLSALLSAMPPAARIAEALQARWREQNQAPEAQRAAQLELAQAAAMRASCADLACPNLAATGKRGSRCSGCHVARYCSRACSVADWRAGHKHACKLLAEIERAAGEN